MTRKADYVRRQGQTRNHECHWPGCDRQVPPAMWGCKPHWFRLPAALRARIWDAYVPGQERRMDPSDEYLAVAREVQEWIAQQAHQERLHPPTPNSQRVRPSSAVPRDERR